jgi:hypothetical protein
LLTPAKQAKRVPYHRLVAGNDRATEPCFQLLDDPKNSDIRAADEVRIRIGLCRFEGAVAPELRRGRAIGVAAAKRIGGSRTE